MISIKLSGMHRRAIRGDARAGLRSADFGTEFDLDGRDHRRGVPTDRIASVTVAGAIIDIAVGVHRAQRPDGPIAAPRIRAHLASVPPAAPVRGVRARTGADTPSKDLLADAGSRGGIAALGSGPRGRVRPARLAQNAADRDRADQCCRAATSESRSASASRARYNSADWRGSVVSRPVRSRILRSR